MFVEDVSPMPDPKGELRSDKTLLAVGWIDRMHRFTEGETSDFFREKLRRLCMRPIRLMRGFHRCEFCRNDEMHGNGEIHVRGSDRIVFVAPTLISHYVDEHRYCPPKEFVAAINAAEINTIFSGPLSVAVAKFTEEPTPQNRMALYQTFVRSCVGFRVPSELGTVTAGKCVITSKGRLRVPTGERGDGSVLFVVLADADILAKHELTSAFAQVESTAIIEMATQNNAGIAICAWLGGLGVWAEIPSADVPHLHEI